MCLVLRAWCRVCRTGTYIYNICYRNIQTDWLYFMYVLYATCEESDSSHQVIMGALLMYAAIWRLVHSQWISSSIESVIKVSSRPLQLCNRTLHAEQGRRSSAIRKNYASYASVFVRKTTQQDVHSCDKHWMWTLAAYFSQPLRFWTLWSYQPVWCCRWSWTCRWAGF